jgi:phosphocarrier protein
MSGTARGEALVTHGVGLHARPAVKLTRLAKGFAGPVRVSTGDGAGWIDAKSVVKVMALKVKKGAVLRFEAEGADAEGAVAALVDLVRRDFDEGAHA